MAESRNEILNVELQSQPALSIGLSETQEQTIELSSAPIGGTRNYNNLYNQPQINGVILYGNKTAVDLGLVSEDSEAGWTAKRTYIPKAGEICLYTNLGKIKIGDGSVPVIDLPFIGAQDTEMLLRVMTAHTTNTLIHVTQRDKERWDAKLNYTAVGETLIFNRE